MTRCMVPAGCSVSTEEVARRHRVLASVLFPLLRDAAMRVAATSCSRDRSNGAHRAPYGKARPLSEYGL